MTYRTICWIALLMTILAAGCGGHEPIDSSTSKISDPYASVGGSPAELVSYEFCSALDESSLTPNSPASNEFIPETENIYFLGTIEKLPAQAQIEVRWFKTTSATPIHASRTGGSDTHTFFSKLQPHADRFDSGNYRVDVYVNGTKVGDTGFQVVDRRSGGMTRVKELSVSTAVEVSTNKPIKKMTSFPRGVKQVYASFFVGGVEQGNTIRVTWSRDGQVIDEIDFECEGEKYYAVPYTSNKGMKTGDWSVEIDIDGEVYGGRSFYVGDNSGYPVIEKAILGTKLGKGRMPKKAMKRFKRGVSTISCGIKFLSVPDDATVDVEWISLTGGSEAPLQSTGATVTNGGVTTVGVTWRTGGKLTPGPHKAVIFVNKSRIQEIPFEVE